MKLRAAWNAARRFRGNPHLLGYTLGKSLLDPVYPAVARVLGRSQMPLLDIGCGAGHLAAFLRATGYTGRVIGVDLDARKIAAARKYLGDANCQFLEGTAEAPPGHCGHVTALDVIHYLAPPAQEQFVRDVAGRVAAGGRAFLRLTLRDESWRFRLTRVEERLIKRLGWIPWAGENFPSREEVEAWAAACGCGWTLAPLWGITPFNSHLLSLHRENSEGDSIEP